MAKPLVTVLIPNYNYGRFLKQTVDSALDQTFRDLEVLVIDDGSTDESSKVLAELTARGDPRFRTIAQKNAGQAAARNHGVREARGEYIALLDADDVWLPTKLEKQMTVFLSSGDPRLGLVYSGAFWADGDLKPTRTLVKGSRGSVLELFATSAESIIIAGESTAVIKKECFSKVGEFDGRLSISAGWDMYRRIATAYTCDYVAEPLIYYRLHGNNCHRRIDVFERDTLLKLEKMFADPMGSRIFHLKKQAYGRTFLMLSGSYLHAKKPLKAIEFGLRSMIADPTALLGWVKRHLGGYRRVDTFKDYL